MALERCSALTVFPRRVRLPEVHPNHERRGPDRVTQNAGMVRRVVGECVTDGVAPDDVRRCD